MGGADRHHDGGTAGDDDSLTGRSDSFGLECGPLDIPPGTDLGGVTIVRLLGEGGMGRVYEARQHTPERPVAVKLLRAGLASRRLMRRFDQEAHLLARLRHPHVAQVHLLGRWRLGAVELPFFVLELVEDARPVDVFARERGLPIRARVGLLARFAAAVGAGHAVGVVHRDVKPANLLVAADGTPKVIDFGVARTTDVDAVAGTLATDAGEIVGTLRYMAPEQFDAAPAAIDGRTDVYALGLVLHELLTGQLPYDLRGMSIIAAARIIREQEPVAVWTIPRALAGAAGVSRQDAVRLAAIVATCLRRSPAGRYATAGDLADDLDRWLDDRPVRARPAGPAERVGRWIRRHRAAVVAGFVTAAAISTAAGTVHVAKNARRLQSLAVRDRALADSEREAVRQEGFRTRLERAVAARDRGDLSLARRLVAEAARSSPDERPATIELAVLQALVAAPPDAATAVLEGHPTRVTAVAASPAGDVLCTATEQGSVSLWRRDDRGTWARSHALAGHRSGVWAVAFSADGRRVATAGVDRTARIWDAATGAPVSVLRGHKGGVYGLAFAPDGPRVATGSADDTLRLWNADTGRVEAVLEGHAATVFGVCFSPDGTLLASGSGDGTVRLWDPADGRTVATLAGHSRRVFNVAFSPDSRTIVSASEDGTARLWQAAGGGLIAVLRHPERVNAAVFATAGDLVATAATDGLVRLWDPRSGAEVASLAGHAAGVWSLAPVAGEGCCFVSGSADTTARLWDAARRADPVLRCDSGVLGVAIAPDGRTAAAGLASGAVVLFDLATCRPIRVLDPAAGRANAVAFAADGRLVAAACGDGAIRVWRCDSGTVDSGTVAATLRGHRAKVFTVAFAPDGRLVASGGDDRTVLVHDLDGGGRSSTLEHPQRVFGVAWHPDGDRLATACEDGVTRIWNSGAATPTLELLGHDDAVNAVAFAADGGWLATGSSDGTVRCWDARDGRCLAMFAGPVGQIWELAIAPDGTRLAAVGSDRRLHLYAIPADGPAATPGAGGGHLLAFDGHADRVWAVAFAPDGRRLVTGSWDATARVWGVSAADVDRARRAAAVPATPVR